MRMAVAVVGPSEASQHEENLAREVGRLLAEQGAVVLCGGLGGVMQSACEGASSAGGLTVGFLPGREAKDANAFVQIPLATGLGEARNAVLVTAAGAVIAIGGGPGTLSEIGLALRAGRPVIGLETWRIEPPGLEPVGMLLASDPEQAVRWALSGRDPQ